MKTPPTLPTSRRPGRKPERPSGQPAVEVVEEATHLLRQLPARGWLLFHGTSIPFVLMLLVFWSEMARAPDASDRLVSEALILAALYILMKCGHAAFGDLLLSRLRRDPERPPRLTLRQWLRLASSQSLIHATMPWVLLLASLPMFPLAWVYAFYRNASLLACGHARSEDPLFSLLGRSLKVAYHAPRSNHALLLILPLVALLLWVNAMVLSIFIPQLAGILTGIELTMVNSIEAMLNTTLVATSVAVAWLLVSPLFHAVYAVRCFEADSVKSGEDLMAGLRALQVPAALPLLVLCTVLWSGGAVQAVENQPVSADRVEQLDQALDDTLAHAEFRWRMPREGRPESEMGWFEKTIFDFTNWMVKSTRSVFEWIGDFLRWLFDRGDKNPVQSDSGRGWFGDPANMRVLLLVLLVVLVVALVVLALRWMAANRRVPEVVAAIAPVIDLRDEAVIATDLPEDEWLRLANEQLAAGDPRLALRALFLGTLARLGRLGLLAITPGKTNGMYLRELSRRPHASVAMRKAFGHSVQLFERCWYGTHIPDPMTVGQVRNHHDTICQNAGNESS